MGGKIQYNKLCKFVFDPLLVSVSSKDIKLYKLIVAVIWPLNHVQVFATLYTAACQVSLSFTISWSLLKLMSSDSVMPSNHIIPFSPFSSCPLPFPASESLPISGLFTSGGQSIGASTSVLPMNIQDWFPLGLTGWISSLSKWLLRVFSGTTVQMHQFFNIQASLWPSSHIRSWLLEKS